jgi:hypothetical protein
MAGSTYLLERGDKAAAGKRREHPEHLTEMAAAIGGADGALLECAYRYGCPINVLARAFEVTENALHGRVRVIRRRAEQPETRLLWEIRECIPPHARDVVLDHRLHGRAAPELAEKHRCDVKWVRRMLQGYDEYAEKRVKGG